MREEIERWLKQSEADFRKAKILFDTENYDGAVFYFQQSVEKALKGLSLSILGEIPKGHSLIFLAQKVKLPKEMLSGVRDLNPEYIVTRYPDIAEGVPAELYDKEIGEKHKKTAEEVLKWVKNQIKK